MINAMVIDEKDNVAVAIEPIEIGNKINCKIGDKILQFDALENIQIYHKVALKEIKKDEAIVKYGEHIGLAKITIKRRTCTCAQCTRSQRRIIKML